MIVREASFSVTDPTIESQIVTLKESGADLLFIVATPKAAAQAIRGAAPRSRTGTPGSIAICRGRTRPISSM
jgi:hypothetical protein